MNLPTITNHMSRAKKQIKRWKLGQKLSRNSFTAHFPWGAPYFIIICQVRRNERPVQSSLCLHYQRKNWQSEFSLKNKTTGQINIEPGTDTCCIALYVCTVSWRQSNRKADKFDLDKFLHNMSLGGGGGGSNFNIYKTEKNIALTVYYTTFPKESYACAHARMSMYQLFSVTSTHEVSQRLKHSRNSISCFVTVTSLGLNSLHFHYRL